MLKLVAPMFVACSFLLLAGQDASACCWDKIFSCKKKCEPPAEPACPAAAPASTTPTPEPTVTPEAPPAPTTAQAASRRSFSYDPAGVSNIAAVRLNVRAVSVPPNQFRADRKMRGI